MYLGVKPRCSHHLQVFSPFDRLSFPFVYGVVVLFFFFAMRKLVSLIGSHLFIFPFISIALGDRPKKTLV